MRDNSSQSKRSTESQPLELEAGKFAIPHAAMRKLVDLAKLIPRELSPSDQAVLIVLLVAAVTALGFGVYLAFSRNALQLLILFLAVFILFLVATIYFLGKKKLVQDNLSAVRMKMQSEKNERVRAHIYEEEHKAAQELSENGRIAWTREVIGLPLADDNTRRQIVADLESIRNTAFCWLDKRHAEIQASQIRVNVFLAKYEEAGKGVVCMLRMPEYFRLGMAGHTDEEIAFRPGEGATGRVFVEHASEVAIFDEEGHTWDDRYTLTEYQKRKIHKELRWIITYPLKNSAGEAMAVLNIDGLSLSVTEDELHHLKGDLQPKVDELEDELNRAYDKVRISIVVEPVQ